MPTKIIKENQLRRIFGGKQVSQEAVDYFDEYLLAILERAYESIKDNPQVKRISKDLAEFIVNPHSIVVINGEDGED